MTLKELFGWWVYGWCEKALQMSHEKNHKEATVVYHRAFDVGECINISLVVSKELAVEVWVGSRKIHQEVLWFPRQETRWLCHRGLQWRWRESEEFRIQFGERAERTCWSRGRVKNKDWHKCFWLEQLHEWWVYLLRLERLEWGFCLATLYLKYILDIQIQSQQGSWIYESWTWWEC